MLTKLQITEHILAGLPEDDRPTYDEACKAWWMNFRDGGGFRLTNAGYMAIGTCDLETYAFDAPPDLVAKPKHLLTLDKSWIVLTTSKLASNHRLFCLAVSRR